ncbi:MAG TPA: cytochrome c oxidase assembly protein [Candidatus Dormibacteraeota bacterium]|jgi:cytochrome c oxidase assembly factor CtaG
MVAVVCAGVAVGYWLGGRRPVRLLDTDRRWSARQWRATAFLFGLLLIVASTGPFDGVVRQSFWMRTAQLILLVTVASPLLVLGAPAPRFRRLIGRPYPGAAFGRLMPPLAFLLFNGALVAAYLPLVYHATAAPGWPRALAQLVMAGLGVVFWSQVIAQPPQHCRLSHLGRGAFLLLSSAQLRLLGLVLGFASTSFYGVPLIDQQLAAGILMVPGVITDLIVLTVCLYLWLGQEDRRPQGRHDSGGRHLPSVALSTRGARAVSR